MEWIDLRSDTVTHPTPEMREAMAHAELGDDVYGEDPTVNRLQTMAADLLGKEAALFVPSGTMGNLASILAHCDRGDEVILGDKSHTFINEAGGIASFGGVHPRPIPNQTDGTLDLEAIEAAIRPDNPHYPVSRLLALENTHNICGGVPLTVEYTRQAGELARRHGLKTHLDGARIFNASAALDVPVSDLTEPVDSVTFCLSKGLCAPVGSVICGDKAFIHKVYRIRKALGGGMRQVGVIAAAGIVALENLTSRMVDDHKRARKLAEELRKLPGVTLLTDPPRTNMIFLRLETEAQVDPYTLAQALSEEGIKIRPSDERRMRLVVHYWIDDHAVEKIMNSFQRVLGAS
ncbi:MAG: low-specificity L-threonine aldolase [Anaerolineales bacterium]|nr:low-specificity L-threonine aldolase [Anaerolineales bacterium]